MFFLDSRFLNFVIIVVLSTITFLWTFFLFGSKVQPQILLVVIFTRLLASFFIYKDYSLSWSQATQKTFLIKSVVFITAFVFYAAVFYRYFPELAAELFLFLFLINFFMFSYYLRVTEENVFKNKNVVIYGAGMAGSKVERELRKTSFRVRYFVDDNYKLHNRSIDGIKIISKKVLQKKLADKRYDTLIIAIPSAPRETISAIYEELRYFFEEIKILPTITDIRSGLDFSKQLKDISVEELLARFPKDLDKERIGKFVDGKTVLITGAGGSIGSELARRCLLYNVKHLLLLDHSEFHLYKIGEELMAYQPDLLLQSVVDKNFLEMTFKKHKIDTVIHAAAYKHVPLSEHNISEVIRNNILGTKNIIDVSLTHNVKKFVLVSTDKAVRPTNVMGASKRVCELYAQNSNAHVVKGLAKNSMEIVSVRFGNVLGSSGSVIPKFKEQIEKGGPITVTHPDITRYFMLISEACDLVLQAASLGQGGEIFILDMGEPIKIVDLAKQMIKLSGKSNIQIQFSGLRAGEKLYEELLLSDAEEKTKYNSITVARKTFYDIEKLNLDIKNLLSSKTEKQKLNRLKKIVPEFKHKEN